MSGRVPPETASASDRWSASASRYGTTPRCRTYALRLIGSEYCAARGGQLHRRRGERGMVAARRRGRKLGDQALLRELVQLAKAPRIAEEDRLLGLLVRDEELGRTTRALRQCRQELALGPRQRTSLLEQSSERRLEIGQGTRIAPENRLDFAVADRAPRLAREREHLRVRFAARLPEPFERGNVERAQVVVSLDQLDALPVPHLGKNLQELELVEQVVLEPEDDVPCVGERAVPSFQLAEYPRLITPAALGEEPRAERARRVRIERERPFVEDVVPGDDLTAERRPRDRPSGRVAVRDVQRVHRVTVPVPAGHARGQTPAMSRRADTACNERSVSPDRPRPFQAWSGSDPCHGSRRHARTGAARREARGTRMVGLPETLRGRPGGRPLVASGAQRSHV